MDYRDEKALASLLNDLEHERETARTEGREGRIRAARHDRRFRDLARTVFLPTLREVMQQLERKGHPTRLREIGPTRLRLDLLLEGTRPVPSAIEVVLAASRGLVILRGQRQGGGVAERAVELAKVDRTRFGRELLGLLRVLAEPPPAPTKAPPPWATR